MSTELAITAVTETLRQLLAEGLSFPNTDAVTKMPPDKARDANASGDQINLFLYHVLPNAAWRNMDLPKAVRPGESAQPALALDLDYLITAYGDNDHKLLGEAMRVMYDTPLLSPDKIRTVFPGSGLEDQVERVRITLQPLSLEDMYRLWNGFQTQYRVSAAYRISVVLIESKRASKAPLPVLKRGDDDRGVQSVTAPAPNLTGLVLPLSHSSALLGDTIVIQGDNVAASDVAVRFVNPVLPKPIELIPVAGDKPGEIKVTLPNDAGAMSAWAPGLYTLSLVVRRPKLPVWTTNELAVGIAPRITRDLGHISPPAALTLTSAPRIGPKQRVLLIFGDRQIASDSITNDADLNKPTSIAFTVPAVDPGSYLVRLRVDGVDSIPVVMAGSPPKPAFDANQIVEIP